MKYLPQIIYILLFLLGLVSAGLRHDKPKEGKYNLYSDLIAIIIQALLMLWGGFFHVFFE